MKALRAQARLVAIALACLGAGIAHADDSEAKSAAALRAKYTVLQDQLSHNQFQRPLKMDSTETSGGVTGDIYALIEYPFAMAGAALNEPARWCDIMMLHINTKYCRASTGSHGSVLQVSIGKKQEQPVSEAYRLDFAYRVAAATPDHLKVTLSADEGPLSTHDYRVILEAVPVDDSKTFVHFTYSYGYGVAGRLALQVYLGTIGRGKVGFTVVGKESDGRPLHIGGMRGLVERNTMRYYLAIEAFLGALSVPPQARLEKRLRDWFAAAERYSRQLHEMEESEYLEMKRKEHLRLQTETLGRGRGCELGSCPQPSGALACASSARVETVTCTASSCSPPPRTTPRIGVTSLKSRPQASVMCSSSTRQSLVGSMSTHPASPQYTDTQACEASAPIRRGRPAGGTVRI
jgi:hypothetical protein